MAPTPRMTLFRPCRLRIAHHVCVHGEIRSGGTFCRAQPLSCGDGLNFTGASVDYRTTHSDLAPPFWRISMKTRSLRIATVAVLSAAFAMVAAGSSRAQNEVSNASNSAVRSAVTDARDAAFRVRHSALRHPPRAHRRAAPRATR